MFRTPIFGFSCTCLLVWWCLTLSHTWQQGVWCFRCRLQPGSRLLLSNIFAYPSAAVPSHAGLIRLAILPNRSAVSAPEPPSSALPVSAPEPPAQALSLLPYLPPDNNAAETAHKYTQYIRRTDGSWSSRIVRIFLSEGQPVWVCSAARKMLGHRPFLLLPGGLGIT